MPRDGEIQDDNNRRQLSTAYEQKGKYIQQMQLTNCPVKSTHASPSDSWRINDGFADIETFNSFHSPLLRYITLV